MTACRYEGGGSRGIRHVGAFVVVALAVGVLTAGCSSSVSTSLSSACTTARTQFANWLESDHTASNAEDKADRAWSVYHNSSAYLPSPSSPALAAAINEYNVNYQQAQALRQKANQDLASYQAAVKGCNLASLPQACREQFTQHQALLDTAARHDRAEAAAAAANVAQQNGYRAGNVAAVNAATLQANAVTAEHNAALVVWNAATKAFTSAESRCSSALG